MRPDVGAVGARLLYEDGTIQHAGVALGVCGFEDGPGVAGHLGLRQKPADPGYFGQSALTREVSAVTGACLAIRKSVYEAVGGLDAEGLTVAFNDVDLCLRIRASGLRIVWTPFAELHHLESASRGFDLDANKIERFRREYRVMRGRWGAELDADPFYNVNFSRFDANFRLESPSARIPPWRPWLAAGDIIDG
jgi:GT2 family glycosyltransferase